MDLNEYRKIQEEELKEIHSILQRLDEAIRGNGRPGLVQRVSILEDAAAKRNHLTWLVLGAFASSVSGFLLLAARLAFGGA